MKSFSLALFLTLIIPLTAISADMEIVFEAQHPGSKRYAIVEQDGQTAYLYLTEKGVPKPIADAVCYSQIEPVEKLDWDKVASTGAPPSLSKEFASSSAYRSKVDHTKLKFLWSDDGNSVAVVYGDTPLAMIIEAKKPSYSNALKKSGPFGEPFDQQKFDLIFRRTG
jgi:hypothetical protein